MDRWWDEVVVGIWMVGYVGFIQLLACHPLLLCDVWVWWVFPVGRGGNSHRIRTHLPPLDMFPWYYSKWDHPMMRSWSRCWEDADWFCLEIPLMTFHAIVGAAVVVDGMFVVAVVIGAL